MRLMRGTLIQVKPWGCRICTRPCRPWTRTTRTGPTSPRPAPPSCPSRTSRPSRCPSSICNSCASSRMSSPSATTQVSIPPFLPSFLLINGAMAQPASRSESESESESFGLRHIEFHPILVQSLTPGRSPRNRRTK